MSQDTGIVTAKVVAMVVLGGASTLLGLTPLIFSRLHRRRAGGGGGGGGGGRYQLGSSPCAALLISLLLAFGGGALLCTTFLHLLPEVREAVEELQESGTLVETKFHLPELLMCSGFFAMYLVEELVHLYLHHRRRRASPHRLQCGPGAQTADSALHRSLSKRRCSRADASCPPSLADQPDACDAPAQGAGVTVSNGAAAGLPAESERVLVLEGLRVVAVDLEKKLSAPQQAGETKRPSLQEDDPYLLSSSSQQLIREVPKPQPAMLGGSSGSDPKVSPVGLNSADEKKLSNGTNTWADTNSNHPSKPVHHPAKHVHHGQAHVHVHLDVDDVDGDDSVLSSLRGLLIVLALSVHELFEGLAVGLQETANLVYYMMGAVAAHKLVLAFCVGVQLIAAGTRPRYIVCYVLTFALVSPIGIGVGLALGTEEGSSVGSSAATATLQGLACGTLLYVVFFEILQREAKGIRQYFATAAGFLIMFAVLITTSEEHDHGHSHGHDHDHDEEHEEAVTTAATAAFSAITDAVTSLVIAR
ncbi:uncharacterized protein LOC124801103 isoform X1 [Schistocerca piceifrons]|uniref:uncharacterized protein LOC124801103 isoform X1 n=1 Tax=Schistocerca piceifrons TaxID=274613 RepID=UPI001F5E7C46|nr:uncharacterized protein LOC124801103 isoform X1 [Schistocerca piceifrons]